MSDKASVPKLVSKQAYLRKADAICKEVPMHYFARLETLEAKSKSKGRKVSKAQRNLKAAVPPLYTAIDELKALPLPKGEEQKAKAFIEAMEAGVEGLEEKPKSKLSGPGSPLEKFGSLTKAYGFEYCSTL